MIVTFYTPGYAKEAEGLIASAAKFGYSVDSVAVSDTGSWEGNCALKAGIIRDALNRHEQILFLDADARILADISELLKPHDGIKLHTVTPDQFKKGWFAQRYRYHAERHGSMWNSGIMSIRRSPEVTTLIESWVKMCEQRPGEWDQICLQLAHIKSQSTVPIADIPAQYRAGKRIIGHKSAFHKLWKKASSLPLRKVLLVGSANYMPKWWAENGEKYLKNGFDIVAMNNACEIVGNDCHLWLIPNDYTGKYRADKIPNNHPGYPRATNKEGNWITKPYWVDKPTTIAFSSLAHLLNESILDGCKLEVHLAGCDMNYTGEVTHFYGKGGADPLRFTDAELVKGQKKLEKMYGNEHCLIFNAGGQSTTRLIFEKVK